MKAEDIVVTLSVEDHVTPVLRALRADLWLLQHGVAIIVGALVSTALLGVAVGFLLALLLR